MKTATLLTVTALSLLLALLMAHHRRRALAIADDAIELSGAAVRSLQDANETIANLRADTPVWLLAGVPMVDVYPTAEDFCLN